MLPTPRISGLMRQAHMSLLVVACVCAFRVSARRARAAAGGAAVRRLRAHGHVPSREQLLPPLAHPRAEEGAALHV